MVLSANDHPLDQSLFKSYNTMDANSFMMTKGAARKLESTNISVAKHNPPSNVF